MATIRARKQADGTTRPVAKIPGRFTRERAVAHGGLQHSRANTALDGAAIVIAECGGMETHRPEWLSESRRCPGAGHERGFAARLTWKRAV
jgi:hypothetical protein